MILKLKDLESLYRLVLIAHAVPSLVIKAAEVKMQFLLYNVNLV